MCRNIRTLFNFEPPATQQEINAAATQFVRVSGSTHPSRANQQACERATEEISAIVSELMVSLVTRAEPKDRANEATRARKRAEKRFAGINQ
jgi:hypothetical protein